MDGENPNELVNFKIQCSAASLMNMAMIKLHDAIPMNKWGRGTGIIGQVHDWIGVECPADGCYQYTEVDPETGKSKTKMHVEPGSIPWHVKHIVEECLNQRHPSLPGVEFTATASVGHSWKDV